MRIQLCMAVLCFLSFLSNAQIKHGLRDDEGRHIIPRGFVVNTNDHKGEVFFNSDDYARMVRMGANTQVIRLELGKLSNFPGAKLETNYLKKLDTLVALGRHSGIITVFKMTVYSVDKFIWEEFWQSRIGESKTYIDAWKVVVKRFSDDDSGLGYDVVNDPRK